MFFVSVIVREQHTLAQESDSVFRERPVSAQKAPFLFTRIRWCSLFFAGFAVNVAVIGGSSSLLLIEDVKPDMK